MVQTTCPKQYPVSWVHSWARNWRREIAWNTVAAIWRLIACQKPSRRPSRPPGQRPSAPFCCVRDQQLYYSSMIDVAGPVINDCRLGATTPSSGNSLISLYARAIKPLSQSDTVYIELVTYRTVANAACVWVHSSAVNMALPALADLLLCVPAAGRSAASLPATAASVDRRDRQTLDRSIDPAAHTKWTVSINCRALGPNALDCLTNFLNIELC